VILFDEHLMTSIKAIVLLTVAIVVVVCITISESSVLFVMLSSSHYYSGSLSNVKNDKLTNIGSSITASSIDIIQPVYAQPQHQEFVSKMTGAQEVPPKNTPATGTATFEPTPDGMKLSYKITLNNIDKVTMAHIHKGTAGENGPIIVTLYNSPSLPTGKLNGNNTLVEGNILADNLQGLLAGKRIPDLIKMIKDNDAYTNVHTIQNPKGEIRGQIIPVSSPAATAAP
jgi:hypothetical protein